MSKTVFISAGHGGSDPGAVNKNLKEAELSRQLRNAVVSELSKLGIQYKTDGNVNENLDRNTAISMASKVDGHKIDLHFNASVNKSVDGVECFSRVNQKEIAKEYANAVASALGLKVRGDNGYRANNESQHGEAGLAWLNRLNNSFLIETCFISNDSGIEHYLSKVNEVAQAIAKIVAKYNS